MGLFGLLSVLGALVAAPGVGLRDAGELASAAFFLGIPHPTGFPLTMIVGRAMCLLPIGDAILRMNLASSLVMAGALALLFRLVIECTVRGRTMRTSLWSGAAALCAMLLSPSVAWFGTSVEVYAYVALLVAVAMNAAQVAIRDSDHRFTLLAMFCAGLSMGTHVSAVAGCGAAAVAAIAGASGRRSHGAGLGAACAGLVLAGSLVIAYLPLRSMAHPLVMWDDLSSPGALFDHLSGARIREAFTGRAGGVALAHDLMSLGRIIGSDTGALVFVLGPCAPFLAPRSSRVMVASLVSLIVIDTVYCLFVNPMGIVDRQVGILTALSLTCLAGMSLAGLLGLLERSAPRMLGASGATLVMIAALARPSLDPAPPCDRIPELWAKATIEGVTPRAVVLCTSDDLCGLSLFMGRVEGRRPDVSIVPRQHLWNDVSVTQNLGRAHPALAKEIMAAGTTQSLRLHSAAREARVFGLFWEVGDGAELVTAFGRGRPPLVQGATAHPPLALVAGGGTDPKTARVHARTILHWMILSGHDPARTSGTDLHFATQRTLARDLLGAGLILANDGLEEQALEAFWLAVAVKRDYAPALTNLAILEASAGNLDRAIALAREAVKADPLREKSARTLARLLEQAGLSGTGGDP